MRMTDLKYSWQNHNAGDCIQYVGHFSNVGKTRSPTSKICHRDNTTPSYVVNIDVTFRFNSDASLKTQEDEYIGRFQTLLRESVKFSNYGEILWPCYFASKVDPYLQF